MSPALRQRASASSDGNTPASASCHTYSFGGFNGTICMADVVDVPAGGSVEYQVGSDSLGWSAWHTLRSPDASSVKMLAWADMGVDWSNRSMSMLAKDAATGQYSAVLATGDMSYANDHCPLGHNGHCTNAPIWDEFFREGEGHLDGSAGPMVQICGNHERYDDFAAYLNRTWSPSIPGKNLSRFYYSTAIGPVTVISFSTEHDVQPGSEIHSYLQEALAHAASPAVRARHPWIIVQSHHPLLCTSLLTWGERCSPTSEAAAFRSALEGLFHEARVDLYLSGHDHNAEASWPYFNGTVSKGLHDADGTVYVVNGAAGDIEGVDPFFVPNPGYRMFSQDDGLDTTYARISASMTNLTMDFVDSHTGSVWKTFSLTK